jgi:very-short-patch-repair endonuclease
LRGPAEFTTERARSLRKADNDAEAKLWSELRNRRLNGYKFVRQEPVGCYFADFACREQRLVVEVDGSQHAGSSYDAARDDFMVQAAWSVLRFWNADVLKERDTVLETILAALEGRLEPEIRSADVMFSAGGAYRGVYS